MATTGAGERAATVESMLFGHYPQIGGFLDHRSPFQLLVAVVLSARCTDRRVNLVTGPLFAAAPTAERLAALPLAAIEELIHSLGFFRRKALALKGLAQRLVENFSSAVPLNFRDLESLPGVGHKTASVLLGSLTSLPTFPVDTHVWRLSRRWGLSAGRSAAAVERDLKAIFPPEKWMGLHLRMVAYGRTECTARRCRGVRCAICRRLAAEAAP